MARSYRERFTVKPGQKVRLEDIDPNDCGGWASRKHAKRATKRAVEALGDLQMRMWAEGKHALLIVLQGRDAAGKDGLIRHVLAGFNPMGCSVSSFRQPTDEELAHDFLWRVHPHAPQRGTVAIFNRSQYEAVLVVRVHHLVQKRVWAKRYDEINEFERMLHEDNQTAVLKFFLHVSKDEQLDRFAKRLDDPSRNWKISEADYQERELWDDYSAAYEAVFERTSTPAAPWFIIPSNHKWFSRLAVSSIIVDAMDRMDMRAPSPRVDLKDIRRRYHSAAKREPA